MSLGMPINCQYRNFLVGHILVTAMWQKYQQIGYEWSHTVSISNNSETIGSMPAFWVQNTLPPHPIKWDTPFHHHEGLYCQSVVEKLYIKFTGESPKQLQRYLMDARTMTFSEHIFWVYFYGAMCAVWSCICIVFCHIHIQGRSHR